MNTVQNIECVTDLSLLVNTSLVDVVADKIRQNIYTGKYEAGKKLIVRELSEEFGVSHTPVKDALNRLISEGYVEALPRRSMVVRTYTNAELLDALEARMMCEVFYADAIIEMSKGHPELVKELKEVMATTRRLVAENTSTPIGSQMRCGFIAAICFTAATPVWSKCTKTLGPTASHFWPISVSTILRSS